MSESGASALQKSNESSNSFGEGPVGGSAEECKCDPNMEADIKLGPTPAMDADVDHESPLMEFEFEIGTQPQMEVEASIEESPAMESEISFSER